MHDGRLRVVAAADQAALAIGLRAGMPLAKARTMLRGLDTREADPQGDAAALARLSAWCLQFAPLTSPDAPDGLWIDATGCAHLYGGEAALLGTIHGRLRVAGFTARVAIADTPGAAHAAARFGGQSETVVPPGAARQAVAPLPVACLRLPAELLDRLGRLGFDRVAHLIAAPRAPLARRFGPILIRRLDQALGQIFEPIVPVLPAGVLARREAFVEPLLTEVAFSIVIERLTGLVCEALERVGQGARRLDLVFERVDGIVATISIGTAHPSRDPAHLTRLLRAKLETINPGLGVEAMQLVVPLAETLAYMQSPVVLADAAISGADLSALVDRLQSRLGAARVYRAVPIESDVPERGVAYVSPLAPVGGKTWSPQLPRPSRLLNPPQPIEVLALLPDHPPRAFTWRQRRHLVRRADGPERILGEWWKRGVETWAVRDYFEVEDEEGRRFWLFRRGDGVDPATGDQNWYLHGVF